MRSGFFYGLLSASRIKGVDKGRRRGRVHTMVYVYTLYRRCSNQYPRVECGMIKTLTKHGNSYALVIDKPILELLNISPDSPLEVSTDGKMLMITLASESSRGSRLSRALGKVNAKHAKALKRLAE